MWKQAGYYHDENMLYCGNLYGTVVKVEMLKGGAEILVRIAPLCATTEDITSHILCIPFVHAIVHKYGPQRLLLLAYDARVDMAHTIHINENIPKIFSGFTITPKARHRRAPESHNKIVPFAPRNNTSHKHSKPKSDTQQTTSSCQATTHCAAEEQYLIRSILTNLRGFGAGASDGTMLLLFAFQCDGHYIRIAHVEWRREHQLVRAHSIANVHIIAEYCRYSSRDNILHTHTHTRANYGVTLWCWHYRSSEPPAATAQFRNATPWRVFGWCGSLTILHWMHSHIHRNCICV